MNRVSGSALGKVIKRGFVVLALGAVVGVAPLASLADDTAGVGMSATGGGATIVPAWQQGNAQGDGNGR